MPKKTVKKAEKTEETAVEEQAPKKAAKKTKLHEYYYAAGKRKTSVARVRLFPKGSGDIIVNEKPAKDYFIYSTSMGVIKSPLKLVGAVNNFDITIKVIGGGPSSQAEAVRHGIAKALLSYDHTYRSSLKKAGFLTRDARIKERKKPGLKRARRAPQFSKR
ncbi:30S ribosomal protein S9 [Pseudomonadota bacterium]